MPAADRAETLFTRDAAGHADDVRRSHVEGAHHFVQRRAAWSVVVGHEASVPMFSRGGANASRFPTRT